MTVRKWVYECEISGRSTFSYVEAATALPSYSKSVLSTELSRLVRAGVIVSVHRGFYVIVPTRYKRTGVVPPLFYVDSLFRYLSKPYYISLLSAAQFFAAAHQKPQIDFVTTVLPRMSNSSGKNPYLQWIYRRQIPSELIMERNGEGGIVRYSSPELTMLELVQYGHIVGGLNAAATVMSELIESVDFSSCNTVALFNAVSGRTVQRTGYLLENVLGEVAQAKALCDSYKTQCGRMEWAVLATMSKAPASRLCEKWKIRVNEEVEPDEL